MRKVADLPNGHELFVENTEQGNVYWSGEIGGGVQVWHTALVAESTLLAALVEEHRYQTEARRRRELRHRKTMQDLVEGRMRRHEI